jgi:hypothetical protein
MGLFTSKIAIGVLAGGFSLGQQDCYLTDQKLYKTLQICKDAGNKITQYESNESSLLQNSTT